MEPYKLIRSGRKSLGLQVKDGQVIVRAPYKTSAAAIEAFVAANRGWIQKHLARQAQAAANQPPVTPLSKAELRELADKARLAIPPIVDDYARRLGVSYGKITVRCQRTRWGSCSAKGNLSFNCLLMLAPPKVLESVIAHELCHLRVMSHSKAFYGLLYGVFPNYDQCKKWLKENGSRLTASAFGKG